MLTDDEIRKLAEAHHLSMGSASIMAFARALCEACDEKCGEIRDAEARDMERG